jgi:hypothetical protein
VSLELAGVPDDTIRLLVLKLVIGPEGDADAERVIVPAKLLRLDPVIVLFAFDPCCIETENGLDVIPKSGPGGDCTMNIPTIAAGWIVQ